MFTLHSSCKPERARLFLNSCMPDCNCYHDLTPSCKVILLHSQRYRFLSICQKGVSSFETVSRLNDEAGSLCLRGCRVGDVRVSLDSAQGLRVSPALFGEFSLGSGEFLGG
jgi:hypothetical protein